MGIQTRNHWKSGEIKQKSGELKEIYWKSTAVDGSQWKSGDIVGVYGSQTNFGNLGISYKIASRVGPLAHDNCEVTYHVGILLTH